MIELTQKINPKFEKPFRIGKKQKRSVLDANGHEVVVFPKGLELMAQSYVASLNEP